MTTKQPERDTDRMPSETALRSLVRSFGLIRRVMEPYFGQYGISGSQWGVLRALQRGEREGLAELRLTDLGNRLLVRPPSITGVVDRLERMGLVRRVASRTDQRSKHVKLTQAGRRLIRQVADGHASQIDRLLAGLDQTEQRQLRLLLDRLAAHLQSIAPGTPAGSAPHAEARRSPAVERRS